MEKATFNSWKNLHPLPKDYLSLTMEQRWREEDMDYLSLGWIPRNKNDKWFLLLDGDRFYVFRARSGFCIFEVLIEEAEDGFTYVTEVRLNNDPGQCQFQDSQAAISMLRQIFRTTLKLRYALPIPDEN